MRGLYIGNKCWPPWTCGQLNTAGIPQEQSNRYRTQYQSHRERIKISPGIPKPCHRVSVYHKKLINTSLIKLGETHSHLLYLARNGYHYTEYGVKIRKTTDCTGIF